MKKGKPWSGFLAPIERHTKEEWREAAQFHSYHHGQVNRALFKLEDRYKELKRRADEMAEFYKDAGHPEDAIEFRKWRKSVTEEKPEKFVPMAGKPRC